MKLKYGYQLVRIAPDFFGTEKIIGTYSSKSEADALAKQRNATTLRTGHGSKYVVRKRLI